MQCNSEISLLFLLFFFFWMRLLAPLCLFLSLFFWCVNQNCGTLNEIFAVKKTACNMQSKIYLCASKYVSKTICSCAHTKNQFGLSPFFKKNSSLHNTRTKLLWWNTRINNSLILELIDLDTANTMTLKGLKFKKTNWKKKLQRHNEVMG